MAEQIDIVNVQTSAHPYSVIIGSGAISNLSELQVLQSTDKIAVVVSSNVYNIHKSYIDAALKDLSNCNILTMEDGEENKNYAHAEEFLNSFLAQGLSRKSAIIAIGGGVVGDFAGYCAALYMRGIPIIQVPTTLLAMVDSSVGGKVAVNIAAGKNIAGAFHQPHAVVSDTQFLATLPENERINGLSEVVKHALIGDTDTLKLINNESLESIFNMDKASPMVYYSARFKGNIVTQDEKEGGTRAILNFGHTIGHAIESVSAYQGISHGEAVAHGMRMAARLSQKKGYLTAEDVKYIDDICKKFGLAQKIISLKPEDVYEHMKYDKKNQEGSIRFVLLEKIGNPVFNENIEQGIVLKVLKNYFKNA